MEMITGQSPVQRPLPKQEVRAADLSRLLDNYVGLNILSLDCFDTLLWRKAATPADVFYDLQQRPLFRSLGYTARLRIQAETTARQYQLVKTGTSEVNLKAIYQQGFSSLDNEQLQALIEDEIVVEIDTCYSFPPIVDLIQKAHARGLKIIIVSDTYFEETQLRRLLQNKLPQNIMAMVSNLFCSCEQGQSKSRGLFKHVLEKLSISANQILHIGDNPIADVAAAKALGLHAVKLAHHTSDVDEAMRMQTLSGSFIDSAIRNTRSLPIPFRGVIAADEQTHDVAEKIIGYTTVGPLFYAFARFILAEIEEMRCSGKQPKVVFLMRDAYLPSRVCEALVGNEIGKRVRISRFAAYASSFRHQDDVDSYLAEKLRSERFQDICKQLQLPEEQVVSILQQVENANDPQAELVKQLHKPSIMMKIIEASTAYRARLYRHLEREVHLEAGDTLVFIDLGYTGNTQIKLAPVFKDELQVEIIGLYLIALNTPHWTSSRVGLLDSTSYDDNALIMLVTYIALLEQIATSTECSVVDYDDSGHAVYSETTLTEKQNHKLHQLQAECVRFAKDTEKFLNASGMDVPLSMLKDTAAINLCRLLFFPTKKEVDYLQSFEFDFNLGTNEILPLFNVDKGIRGLRRRSWLYSSKENIKNMRTNYPAEWRSASIELSLTLMAQHRFGLQFALNDLSHRRESLQIVLLHGKEVSAMQMEAIPTYDGFFSLLIPIVNNECNIGIQFGLHYKWVEIDSAELILLSALYTKKEFEHTIDASAQMTAHEMTDKGGGLYECHSETSILIYIPDKKREVTKRILRIIFRPIGLS